MNLDAGRKFDLEEMNKDYQNSKSIYKKTQIEKIMNQVLSASKASGKLREEMIKAIRANDRNRLAYCRVEMRKQEADRINNNIQL